MFKPSTPLTLLLLFVTRTISSSFVFEVSRASSGAQDNTGNGILPGKSFSAFSMNQKRTMTNDVYGKGPCVIITYSHKGGRLMVNRGAMIMVFREGISIYGSHKVRSNAGSKCNSPQRSPRRMEPTRSGSCTPPIFRTQDGGLIVKRPPKILPKSYSSSGAVSFDGTSNIPRSKILNKNSAIISPQNSGEYSTSSKTYTGNSPQNSFSSRISPQNSSERSDSINDTGPSSGQSEASSSTMSSSLSANVGPLSSQQLKTPRLLRSSESKGTMEIFYGKPVETTALPQKVVGLIEHGEIESESLECSTPTLIGSTKECIHQAITNKKSPREEGLLLLPSSLSKSNSAPLNGSRKRHSSKSGREGSMSLARSDGKTNQANLSLALPDGKKRSRTSSRVSSKKSSPRKDSDSPRANSVSPRNDSDSTRANSVSPRNDSESPSSVSPRKDSKSPRGDSISPRKDPDSPRSNGSSPRSNKGSPRKLLSAESSPRLSSGPTSAAGSQHNSPRSDLFEEIHAGISKNIDITIQLEPDDIILAVIPNHDTDYDQDLLDAYHGIPDHLDEIRFKPIKLIGEYALVRVAWLTEKQEEEVDGKEEISRMTRKAKRRSKSLIEPPTFSAFTPTLTPISHF